MKENKANVLNKWLIKWTNMTELFYFLFLWPTCWQLVGFFSFILRYSCIWIKFVWSIWVCSSGGQVRCSGLLPSWAGLRHFPSTGLPSRFTNPQTDVYCTIGEGYKTQDFPVFEFSVNKEGVHWITLTRQSLGACKFLTWPALKLTRKPLSTRISRSAIRLRTCWIW